MSDLFGIPGLNLAGVSTTGILLYLVGLSIKTWLERRKLSLEDRTALVAGFSSQAESLMQENRKLRTELSSLAADQMTLREHHSLCQMETAQLRNEVLGFKRQLHEIASAVITLVPPDVLKGTIAGSMISELLKQAPDGK